MGANPNQYQTGADSLNCIQVTVGTSPTEILPANPTRRAVTITNTGTNPVYTGETNGVLSTTGDLIAGNVGQSKTYCVTCAIWGIATGGTQVVTVAEEFDAGGP